MTLNRYEVVLRSTRSADERRVVIEAATADDAMAIAKINHCCGHRWEDGKMVPLEVPATILALPSAAAAAERAETVLRQTELMILAECESADITTPPARIHPADLVEKYLCRELHQRIATAEKRAEKAEANLIKGAPAIAREMVEQVVAERLTGAIAARQAAERALAALQERTDATLRMLDSGIISVHVLRDRLSPPAPAADASACRFCGAAPGMRHGEACPELHARRDGSPG